ncbi:uncharacterized protein PRCAT00003266001 [Priceomyces carsonii]|uniref:uncharacterized protein n=1 Tax=Priceomyces carsonii TaxID=28549 RepID=UPI002EDA1FFF|nr:unnamed protein product [Priceomyces carsonii]
MAQICTESLDEIQFEIFNKIEGFIALNELDNREKTDAERFKIIAEATKLILKYYNYLQVFRANITTDKEKELCSLYESKLKYLKVRLREVQLFENNLENELIHRRRIEKYRPRSTTEQSLKKELFQGRSLNGPEKASTETVEDQILFQNKKITSSLQSTRHLLSSSILQTELNIDSLDQQSKDLGDLNNQLFKLSDILTKSSQVVKFIEKQDRNDKRRIYMSIYFFIACCSWVIWKRILRIPTKFFLWSLLRVFRIFNWLIPNKDIETIFNKDGLDALASSSITSLLISTIVSTLATSSIDDVEESPVSFNDQQSQFSTDSSKLYFSDSFELSSKLPSVQTDQEYIIDILSEHESPEFKNTFAPDWATTQIKYGQETDTLTPLTESSISEARLEKADSTETTRNGDGSLHETHTFLRDEL